MDSFNLNGNMDLNMLNGLINMVEKKIKKLTAKIPKIKSKKSKKNKYKFIGGVRFTDPKKYETVLKALLYLLDRDYLGRNNLIPFSYSTDPQHIILIDDIIKRNGRATEAYSMPAYDIILIKSDSPHTGTIRRKIYNFFTDQFTGKVNDYKDFIKVGLTPEEKSDIILVDAKSRGELTEMDDGPSEKMSEITTESGVPYFVVSFRTIHNDTESKENTEETIKKMLMNPVESFKEVIFTSPTQRRIVEGRALQGIFRPEISSGDISSIAERAEEEMKVAGETGQKGFKQKTPEELEADRQRRDIEALKSGMTVASEAVARSREQVQSSGKSEAVKNLELLLQRQKDLSKPRTTTRLESEESVKNKRRREKEEEETKARLEAKSAKREQIKTKFNNILTQFNTTYPALKKIIESVKSKADKYILENLPKIKKDYQDFLSYHSYYESIPQAGIDKATRENVEKFLYKKGTKTLSDKYQEIIKFYQDVMTRYDELINEENDKKKRIEEEQERKNIEAQIANQKKLIAEAEENERQQKIKDIELELMTRLRGEYNFLRDETTYDDIVDTSDYVEVYASSIIYNFNSLDAEIRAYTKNINTVIPKYVRQLTKKKSRDLMAYIIELFIECINKFTEIINLRLQFITMSNQFDLFIKDIFTYKMEGSLSKERIARMREYSTFIIEKYLEIIMPVILFVYFFEHVWLKVFELNDEEISDLYMGFSFKIPEIDDKFIKILLEPLQILTNLNSHTLMVLSRRVDAFSSNEDKREQYFGNFMGKLLDVENFSDSEKYEILLDNIFTRLREIKESSMFKEGLQLYIVIIKSQEDYLLKRITDKKKLPSLVSAFAKFDDRTDRKVVIDIMETIKGKSITDSNPKKVIELSTLYDRPKLAKSKKSTSSSTSSTKTVEVLRRLPVPPPVATSTTAPPTRRKTPPVSVRSDDSMPPLAPYEEPQPLAPYEEPQQQQQQQQQPAFDLRGVPAEALEDTTLEDLELSAMPNPSGGRKGLWELHKVYISKPISLEKAKKIAKKFIKGNKTFYKEYPEKYNFRNIPKQKFNMFRGKKLNDEITLIYGRLKPENSNLKRKKGGIKIEDLDGFESNSDCD